MAQRCTRLCGVAEKYVTLMGHFIQRDECIMGSVGESIALSPNDYSPIDSLRQCIDEMNSGMQPELSSVKQGEELKPLHLETKTQFSMLKCFTLLVT